MFTCFDNMHVDMLRVRVGRVALVPAGVPVCGVGDDEAGGCLGPPLRYHYCASLLAVISYYLTNGKQTLLYGETSIVCSLCSGGGTLC